VSVLSVLADQEEAILGVVGSLTGLMEKQHERLVELGVYAEYQAVFGGYLRLLSDPEAGAEALKRALFLSWYDLSEPACFTGVSELPSDGRYLVLEALNSAFARGAIDNDLPWMVPYYHHLTDFAFPNLNDHPVLARFLEDADPESYLRARLESRQFEGRGQMGRYWQSILSSPAYRPRP